MRDWNVVITALEDGYRRARKLLEQFGDVDSTEFYNVLVMKVADPDAFLEDLGKMVAESPGLMNDISRVIPAHEAFDFQNVAQFEEQAREVALAWAPRLAGRSFYVRLHRRGLKGTLSSPEEERFLDDVILDHLSDTDAQGRIVFADPDNVIDVETVGGRASMSLWSREDLRRFPFLRVN